VIGEAELIVLGAGRDLDGDLHASTVDHHFGRRRPALLEERDHEEKS
jgi:hypothetical protein